jgi:hypothetical protein
MVKYIAAVAPVKRDLEKAMADDKYPMPPHRSYRLKITAAA